VELAKRIVPANNARAVARLRAECVSSEGDAILRTQALEISSGTDIR
jgi:hypothetical protein